MNTRLQRSVRWALNIGGVLGLICTAAMIPVALDFAAKGGGVVSFYVGLPSWAQWGAVPPTGFAMVIVGALCALLLVSGRWPTGVCAALAAAWFIYAEVAFASGGYWEQQIAVNYTRTPYFVAGLVSAAMLLAVSVLALVTAALTPGSVQSAGDVARQLDS